MNVKTWAEENNLKLNCAKSKEIVFTGRGSHNNSVKFPPYYYYYYYAAFNTPCVGHKADESHLDICQVHSITALRVVLNDKMTATDYVSSLVTSYSSSLYAMRVLRDHGLPTSSRHDVFRAAVIATLTYCAPAWSGLCSAND